MSQHEEPRPDEVERPIIDVSRRRFLHAGTMGLAGLAGATALGVATPWALAQDGSANAPKDRPPIPKRLQKWRSEGKYVELMTGMKWPLAPMIVFWAEREAGFTVEEVDATWYIGQISPRPVFIMMGCKDDYVSLSSGDDLYTAAGEPKPYWLSPEGGHSDLNEVDPETFDKCVVTFFDQYLLGDSETTMADCLPPLAECPSD